VTSLTTFFLFVIYAAILLLAAIGITGIIFEKALGVSSMPTMPRIRRRMITLAEPRVAGNIVELGCGWGGLALAAAKAYPDRKIIGIEYSPLPFFCARIRKILNPSAKNLSFIRENFFDIDLSGTASILCYLSNPLMAKLKEKFLKELPENATVVSSTFYIPDFPAEKTEKIKGLWNTEIFVYRKKTK
jgi:phospholipid N-methyltransferase